MNQFMTTWGSALWRQRWLWGLILSLAAGVTFRLIWIQDIEFKGDESWTFDQVRAFWSTHQLPLIGMDSSTGVPNSGMSIWVFIGLSIFVPLDNPLALTRAVQVINVIALLLLAVFSWKVIDRSEREPWLWSVAMVSVNPLSVLFSRKIWAQDTLPIFTLGMLVGWWYRREWWGAFAWGLIGALIGQIHLGGFFFAAAFLICTVFAERSFPQWRAWLLGSILGAAPMIPWLLSIAEQSHAAKPGHWINLAPLFLVHWISMALGVQLKYSLGHSFVDFLGQPLLAESHTYVAAALIIIICAVFLAIIVRAIRHKQTTPSITLVQMTNSGPNSINVMAAGLLGYGLLLTLTLHHVFLHYFVIAFSLPMLSLACLARIGSSASDKLLRTSRILLTTIVCAQAGLTFLFLNYIHDAQTIDGDYGTAYGSQELKKIDTTPAPDL